jgi:hypothetical protein
MSCRSWKKINRPAAPGSAHLPGGGPFDVGAVLRDGGHDL